MSLKEVKEEFNKKRDSRCKKHFRGHHSWEKLGVVLDSSGDIYQVWRCAHCHLCILEPLKFL